MAHPEKKAGSRGRPRSITLTQDEFAQLAARASMPEQDIEAARLALVERLPTSAIVERLGLANPRAVAAAVSRFLKLRSAQPRGRAQSLSPAEFDRLLPLLVAKGTSERRIEAARLALVDGLPAQEIANRLGWKSRQAVSSAKAVAWDLFSTMVKPSAPALPPGWVLLTIAVPADLAARVQQEAEQARKKTRP